MNLSTYIVERAKRLGRRFTERERTRTKIARQYLSGEGIEIGALHKPLRTAATVRYVDRLSRSDLRKEYPELAALPLVDPQIIDDGETLQSVAPGSQDFIVANHFIEHCSDPIGTLRVFASKLRHNGVIYMAVPDKRFCFDSQRPSTPFEHLESDHVDGGAASREAHFIEFARFSHYRGKASEAEVQALAHRWLAENYSIHYHVWTFEEFGDFLRRLIETRLPELEVVVRRLNRDEGIFILRRQALQ
jgi:predicted SAM-dependent methyltransferase